LTVNKSAWCERREPSHSLLLFVVVGAFTSLCNINSSRHQQPYHLSLPSHLNSPAERSLVIKKAMSDFGGCAPSTFTFEFVHRSSATGEHSHSELHEHQNAPRTLIDSNIMDTSRTLILDELESSESISPAVQMLSVPTIVREWSCWNREEAKYYEAST
jgi:hypothetical protein